MDVEPIFTILSMADENGTETGGRGSSKIYTIIIMPSPNNSANKAHGQAFNLPIPRLPLEIRQQTLHKVTVEPLLGT